MLVWYILSLEPPFGSYSPQHIVEKVFNQGSRPPIFEGWPSEISSLLRRCWDANIPNRPEYSEIVQVVKNHLTKLENV